MTKKAVDAVLLLIADFKQLISLAHEERGYVIALQNIINRINERLSPEDQEPFSKLCDGAISMPIEAIRACIMPLSPAGVATILDVIKNI